MNPSAGTGHPGAGVESGGGGRIAFARLPQIPLAEIAAHMSDPRIAAHLPLLTGPWDEAAAAAFVDTKEACWRRDGLGHWAFLHDGTYAGWGGFQKEGEEWDFGMVLAPGQFGLGPRLAHRALRFARQDPRITHVTFLMAPSRRYLGGLERIGARFTGKVAHQGAAFLKYRLETP